MRLQFGGDSIQKQDLIRVHADLAKMKNSYEKMGYQEEFEDYNELFITPMHIHKSKDDHEKAIFMLSSKLSLIVAEENAVYQTSKTKTKSPKKILPGEASGIFKMNSDEGEK
ncbi:hypothetical protein MmiEs2_00930 [Methanimicrococcus stummii]|uniref:Metal-binding protein n=1 Tax=Methanimicrococcus stummii TaxID=3028294 RepID=A0AA96V7C8_9EURY|nr:UPF0058 family protein [Methanimicrococcus sp. Es2]WNY27914.1 hypothetical protein MmiEs2_00930 [Methanimicrococcus sp. Es2]